MLIGIKEYAQNSLSRLFVAISRSYRPQTVTIDS
jgi:hypothetical protein